VPVPAANRAEPARVYFRQEHARAPVEGAGVPGEEVMLSDRSVRLARRRAGGLVAASAFIGAFLLVGAAPTSARADSNFERGFEDQMGRILAYEAVNLGKHILVRGVLQPHPAYYGSHGGHPPYAVYGGDHRYGWNSGYDHGKRYDHDRGYWKRGHRKHFHHHHDHDDCDH
jgi:hypothetical protein